MSITNPSALQPSGVSISPAQNRALYNDMNVILPQFERQLIGKYGPEMALLFELMGQTVVEARTKTREFDWFERRRIRQYVSVNANVGSATAGASITVTIKSGDHYSSGTESSLRVGEAGQISSTGKWFYITAIDKSSASAHTATIKPVNSADKLASSGQASTLLASDLLLFKGNVYAGERSTQMNGIAPIIDTFSNTTTEIRDDYPITDRALAEEIKVGDQSYGWYYKLATTDLNKRMMFSIEDAVFEGRVADQGTGSTVGTLGMIPKVQTAGGQIGYTSGSFGLTNLLEACRYLDWNGGTGTYMWLFDWNQGEEINRYLDGKYNTAVDSTGKDIQKYGFMGWKNEAYNFNFKRYRGFSPEASYGAIPATGFTHFRANFGVLIPNKINLDPETGKQVPSLQVVYQEVKPGVKILTTETGMLADSNQTTTAEKVLSALCYVGARVYAANQFAIVSGS